MMEVPLTAREAASGIFGSISIACWIFLLVPQLIENYKCGSADGISLLFLFIWFVGDIANLAGAAWAHLVPVIVAIAVYFCIADTALIGQCIYYAITNAHVDTRHPRGSFDNDADGNNVRRHGDDNDNDDQQRPDHDHEREREYEPDPTTPLLSRSMSENLRVDRPAIGSGWRVSAEPGHHHANIAEDPLAKMVSDTEPQREWVMNALVIAGVCASGAAGWLFAWQSGVWRPVPGGAAPETPFPGDDETPLPAVVLGYFSAICYLGARIPQIIKNYREKSCDGLALLFFIFSLLGNITYGAGILFHSTERDYFLINLPWLIGSLGTMIEDITIFVQFRIYSAPDEESAIV